MDAAAHKRFDADKKAAQDNLVADSQIIKEQVKSNSERIAELDDHLRETVKLAANKTAQLAAMKAPEPVHIEDLPDFAAQKNAIEQRIAELKSELSAWDEHASTEKDKLRERIRDAEQQKAQQDAISSKVQLRKGIENRIAELEQERHTKAAYIEHIDCMLDLCEQFIQEKVERVSAAVNERFQLVSFRLFTETIGGSLQDCCDPIVNGVPYGDLNSAMQINAGLDCIKTLSEFYNVHVPLFVDNAESVTNLYNMDTQVIRLVVSENDTELRCEA
nr:MAG TPA: chromosome partition protein [Caudoviricetes sp.]